MYKVGDRVIIVKPIYQFIGWIGFIKNIKNLGHSRIFYEVIFDNPSNPGTKMIYHFFENELNLMVNKKRILNFEFDPYGEENWYE